MKAKKNASARGTSTRGRRRTNANARVEIRTHYVRQMGKNSSFWFFQVKIFKF